MTIASSVVEDVVNEKTQAGEMFTAFDITTEIRNRSHRVKHDEVRDLVHDYYTRGGLGIDYTRTTISVASNNQQQFVHPWLYHRLVDNPLNYQQNKLPAIFKNTQANNPPVVQQQNQPITIPSNLLSSNSSNSSNSPILNKKSCRANPAGLCKARNVDARGTLSVPANVLKKIGFQAGQKVYAVAVGNGVSITPNQPAQSTVFKKYTVDCHGQVRITQALLRRAGIPGNKYDVDSQSDKVVLTLSK